MLGSMIKEESDLDGLIDQIGSALDDWNFTREIQEISEADNFGIDDHETNSFNDALDAILNDERFSDGTNTPQNTNAKCDDTKKVTFSETVLEKTISSGISSLKADSSREFFSSINTGMDEIDQHFDYRDYPTGDPRVAGGHDEVEDDIAHGHNHLECPVSESHSRRQSPTVTMACRDPFSDNIQPHSIQEPNGINELNIQSPISLEPSGPSFLPKGNLSSPTRPTYSFVSKAIKNHEQSEEIEVDSPWEAYQNAFNHEIESLDDFTKLARDQESALEGADFNLDDAFAEAEEISFLQENSEDSGLSVVETFHDDKSILDDAPLRPDVPISSNQTETMTTPHTQRVLPPIDPLFSPGTFFASKSGKLGALGKMVPSRERPLWYTPQTDEKGQAIDPIGQTPSEREEKKAKEMMARQVRPPLYVSPNLGSASLVSDADGSNQFYQQQQSQSEEVYTHMQQIRREAGPSPLSELCTRDVEVAHLNQEIEDQHWQNVTDVPRISFGSTADERSIGNHSNQTDLSQKDEPMKLESLLPLDSRNGEEGFDVRRQNKAAQILSAFSQIHEQNTFKGWYDDVLNGTIPQQSLGQIARYQGSRSLNEFSTPKEKSKYHILIPEKILDFRASDYNHSMKQNSIQIEIGPVTPKCIKRVALTLENVGRKTTGWKMNTVGQTYLLGSGCMESRPLDYPIFKFSSMNGKLEGESISTVVLTFSPLLSGTYIHTTHLRANARTISLYIKGFCGSGKGITRQSGSTIATPSPEAASSQASTPRQVPSQVSSRSLTPSIVPDSERFNPDNHIDLSSSRFSLPDRPDAPQPATAEQTFLEDISILHHLPSQKQHPVQSLQNPAVIEFDPTFLGRKRMLHVHVCNSSHRPVHVSLATAKPFFIPTKQLSVPAKSFIKLPIMFIPKEVGCYYEKLVLSRQTDDQTSHQIKIDLEGIAV